MRNQFLTFLFLTATMFGITMVSAQDPLLGTQNPAATTAPQSDEHRSAMVRYLPAKEDQDRILDVRDLLRNRVVAVQAPDRVTDVENGDGLILCAMAAIPVEKRDASLKALDQIWDVPEDYYGQLLDVYSHLPRYRAWLGPDRFDRLTSQREFLVAYRPDFTAWREKQPTRSWRYGEQLVVSPPYAPGRQRVGQPARPSFRPPSLVPAGSAQASFPRSFASPFGTPGTTISGATKGGNPAGDRIIVPNLDSGQGPGALPVVPIPGQ